jgi:hypothetical protein
LLAARGIAEFGAGQKTGRDFITIVLKPTPYFGGKRSDLLATKPFASAAEFPPTKQLGEICYVTQ